MGLAATFVVAVMVLGAFSMWTVIPFGWIWIGSMIAGSQQPSGGPYMLVFFGIVCSIIAMSWVLSRLNRLYVRITGSSRAMKTARYPHRAKKRSAQSSSRFPIRIQRP